MLARRAIGARPLQAQFASVERFSEATWCTTFNAAEARNGFESILAEPGTGPLRCKTVQEAADLAVQVCRRDGDEHVRLTEIAVVFGYLVLQDQMRPKRVPRELTNQLVILVAIVQMMREDHIR